MAALDVPAVDYTDYTDRQLAAIPLAVLVLALAVLGGWFLVTGAPVTPGIEFTGGTELQLTAQVPQGEVGDAFATEPESITPTSGENTYIVTFQSTDTDALAADARAAGYNVQSVQSTSASFGSDTQQLGLVGLLAAFVGMALLVFVLFRTFVPSIAVILSAFSDIVVPLALMNLFGIELSLGTVAALLMLIGYSVDSDILLNNHVLKRRGDFYESTYRARRTGVTMTLTSMSAMAVMAIVASKYVFNIPLLSQVGVVLVMGLAVDLMNTYLLNVSLLRWYKFEGVAR
ncbi:protein translocase subunit SecF [Halococcus sediminicola]|uniref:protein translocase subunit SecF n=1 Tax=Halococcus sediminicola TaxID=1264579 RepID=UPI000679B8B2|nr:protein translocase subunit SecF [Halococcus sediminicola]